MKRFVEINYLVIMVVLISLIAPYPLSAGKTASKPKEATKSAKQNAKDAHGWNKAEWGMTKEQLLKAIDGAVEIEKTPYTSEPGKNLYEIVKVPEVTIGIDKFSPALYMSEKDNKLHMVKLFHGNAIESQFGNIKSLLTQKYGSPTLDDQVRNRDDYENKAKWILPSTSIELVYIGPTRHFPFSPLCLVYTDIKFFTEDMDKL
ncbi:MAG: hypothetical protein ABFD81_19475 [Syntrophaceae bacterium]